MPLTDEIIAQSLSLLAKTGNGLAHAYTRLESSNRFVRNFFFVLRTTSSFLFFLRRNLTDISRIESFVHLRFVDLSNNRLRSVQSLNRLKFLLTLKLDANEISHFDLPPLPYLQTLSLSNNRLRTAVGIEQPRLETLNLNRKKTRVLAKFSFYNDVLSLDNQLESCAGLEQEKLPNLITLEMRENRLTTTKGLGVTNLKNLFLVRRKNEKFSMKTQKMFLRLGSKYDH